MSYSLGQVAYSPQQADDLLGWTPKRRRAYWNARAQACTQFSDEGECLARVARHVPVTLGDTAQDVETALNVTAGLFRDPDATLRQYGPPIIAAADTHVVSPLMSEVGKALTPYMLKYVLPVIAGLYVTTGIAAYYAWQNHERGRPRAVSSNPRRRRRRRRTSRR
jgi:hypothetical protein